MAVRNARKALSSWLVLGLLFAGCHGSDSTERAGEGEGTSSPGSGTSTSPQEPELADPEGLTEETPMMVFFTRDWCTPCQVMKPWLEEIRTEHPRIAVARVNLDRTGNHALGRFFKVAAVPVLVFVDREGKILERQQGTRSKKQMLRTLEELAWLE